MVYRSASGADSDGSGNTLDLDQRATSGAGSPCDRRQRARAAGDLSQRSEKRPGGCGEAGSIRAAGPEDSTSDCPSHGRSTGSSHPDSCPQPDRSSADGGGECGARVGEALRLSSASLVHALLREAMRGRAAARSGSGAWPGLEQIAEMTVKIKHYDRAIKRLTEAEYPETQALIKVYGVGQLTALTYVLTLGSKERFQRSRDVGCYLGLRPRRSQSGDRDPKLGITKAATSISVACWSSVPTTCLGRMERIRAYDSGAFIWPHAEASRLEIVPSLPLLASWRYCSIASGSPRSHTSRSMP